MNLSLLLTLAGCASGPIDAPFGSTLLIPDDSDFSMNSGLERAEDGFGNLFIADFYVSGEDYNGNIAPLAGIKVEIISGWIGTYVIPEEAVTVATSFEEGCPAPSEDPENPCHYYFDNNDENWVQFLGDYEDLGDFRPTYFSGPTDNHGRLRTYLFVDSVPLDGNGDPAAIPVFGSISGSTQAFTLTPISDASG